MSDEKLIEQVARVDTPITDAECENVSGHAYALAELIVLGAHGTGNAAVLIDRFLAAINLPALTAWRNAVIDELTSLHIYSAEHDADPRKAVLDIVEWNQRLALDPAVSAEARALMVRGGEMVKAEAKGAVTELEIAAQDADMRDYVNAFRDANQAIRALSVPAIVEASDENR